MYVCDLFATYSLDSGIDVGLTFINFGFFFRPYGLIRVQRGYLDGYLLHKTCLFKTLRLFFLPNFSGPTFIPCHTSIPEAGVQGGGENSRFDLLHRTYLKLL